MGRGRPRLRIGERGRISRVYLGGGVWRAECRVRDSDGVTRRVQRVGPPDENDRKGKLAEDALIEALAERRPPAAVDTISLSTLVMALVGQHIDRLADDGKALRTVDTYRYDAAKAAKFIAGVTVGEATPARLDAALRSMRAAHGATMARRTRTLLRGGLQIAVLHEVVSSNPCRDVSMIRSKAKPKGAPELTGDQLRDLLAALRQSEYCQRADLVDPITVLVATGLRRGELLALHWSDFNAAAGTLTVCAKVVRQHGHGLQRVAEAKTEAGLRTIPLPRFAIAALAERRHKPFLGAQEAIFSSSAGTLRDPDNFNKQWRAGRAELDLPDVTSHSFRKSVATLIDDAGLSARIGADQLGHAHVSMTQDRYMGRGRIHRQVADLLDEAVTSDALNDD